jgi:glycosyltransferase involved in cell wall biosynthesis
VNTRAETATAGAARYRILIVGMHNSIHVERWLRMMRRPDTALLVFPSYVSKVRLADDLKYVALSDVSHDLAPGLWVVDSTDVDRFGDAFVDRLYGYNRWRHDFLSNTVIAAPGRLRACIQRFDPCLIHSMEVQLAGYLCFETARRMGNAFPPWILSNWGSDIMLFRKLDAHAERIRQICQRIDYYMAECGRDQQVARDYGYRGPTLPVFPASGGADVAALTSRLRKRPSQRRAILVKGYHGWSGRALLALSAIAIAHRSLAKYRVVVPLASPDVKQWIDKLRAELALDIVLAPYDPDHGRAIDRLADARAVIGAGISDGISTTLLESMAVGAFPIQSSTACADEWVECGKTGFIVSPWDTGAIAEAIHRAATDDELVDAAAAVNLRTVASRWSMTDNGARVWEIYERAAAGGKVANMGAGE